MTPVPLPRLSLVPGEFYFRLDGRPSFLFSRNLGGSQEAQYKTFLDWSAAGGSLIVRIPLECLGMGFTANGDINETWALEWERIFDHAAADGIYVLPILGGWIQWNNGSGPSSWASNPMNAANGGPTKDPVDLFRAGSNTQSIYMGWMEKLVKRWQGRSNIAAWEIYSELNMSPATQAAGIDFVNTAAARIRAADPSGRLVTASLADSGTWPDFYTKANIDFVQLHPYPPSGQLDRNIITAVRQSLAGYGRPVLIGESGLSADTPDSSAGAQTIAENAERGVHHAIWAGIVSGAMNGRALWWEDGFGIYFQSLGIPWMQRYRTAELPAANFVRGVDFSGFTPVPTTPSAAVWGAAVGNNLLVLGWFRDAGSEPPGWTIRPLSGQSVSLTPPGSAADWRVDFYDTNTGTNAIGSSSLSRTGSKLTIPLPEFTDDIAFKLTALGGALAATSTTATTDPIAGSWSGTITNTAGTFSTPITLSLQASCEPNSICGTFNASQLSCSGSLQLAEINAGTFVFIETDVRGAVSCTGGGTEYLQLQNDGTLLYQYAPAPGAAKQSSGILQRR
jgi:hypothetical protein